MVTCERYRGWASTLPSTINSPFFPNCVEFTFAGVSGTIFVPLVSERCRTSGDDTKRGGLTRGDCLIGRLRGDRGSNRSGVHGENRLIASRSAEAVAHDDVELRPIVRDARRRRSVTRRICSVNGRQVLSPLVRERCDTDRGHGKRARLTCDDSLIHGLHGDCGSHGCGTYGESCEAACHAAGTVADDHIKFCTVIRQRCGGGGVT